MREFYLRHELRLAAGAVLVATVASALRFGWQGAFGMVGGIAASWIHLVLLWRVIVVLGESSKQQPVVRQGTTMVVLGFAFQLPIFILFGFAATKLGHGSLSCFVTGIGMVYLALIGWAISRT